MSNALKLVALDAEDLKVISAHVQDAVIKVGEISYKKADQQVVLPLNRFAWELASSRRLFFKKHERRLSVLHFSRVLSMRAKNIDPAKREEVLSLLAINFIKSDDKGDPSGEIELSFSAGAALSLKVECLEAQLSDLGAAWQTTNRPRHQT